MDIQIANRQKRHPISLRKLRRRTRIILDALKSPEGEISLLLVDDPQIAAMNRRFLGREGPTNVIAFPMREGRFSGLSPNLLGDVVISVDTAHREARAAGSAVDERIAQLLVHGILHLYGYDHENDAADARRMAAKSRRLLKLIETDSKHETRNKFKC
jgi:probable rRNA maturation factor